MLLSQPTAVSCNMKASNADLGSKGGEHGGPALACALSSIPSWPLFLLLFAFFALAIVAGFGAADGAGAGDRAGAGVGAG